MNTNYYTKSVVDENNTSSYLFIMDQVDRSHYTKSQSDANYYNKTYVASFNSVYTKKQSDGNYYNETYIDSSLNDVYNKSAASIK